jgi:predicted Zn-dependent protease
MSLKKIVLSTIFLFCGFLAQAQDQLYMVAKEYLAKEEYDKAGELFAKLHDNSPADKTILESYTACLVKTKNYKVAEKILKASLKKNKTDAETTVMLYNVYTAWGEEKKAKKLMNTLLDDAMISETSMRETAKLFDTYKWYDKSILLFEEGRKKANNPLAFAEELATLYDKTGEYDKATESLLDLAATQPQKTEDVKTALLRLFNQPEKVAAVKKKIIKRINENAEVVVYPDILAWLYIQQGDYESAFVQVKAIDTRLQENGRRVLQFANIAAVEKKYTAAYEAYDFVIAQGKENPSYASAYAQKISLKKSELELKPNYSAEDVSNVLSEYEKFLKDNPAAEYSETQREYAMLLARYGNEAGKAIKVLEKITNGNAGGAVLRAKCKLDLGDYQIIEGNNWEATLLYSQVDKDFKNDMLGEEARFRNAKLSYYMGDFTWAQGQLDVLKASTSELIANDALHLSVLIVENSAKDTDITPLETFSRAELCLFQNKIADAKEKLDSITSFYPEHALIDDILMVKADLEIKQHHYTEALAFLEQVYTKHKDDVLADDAIYKSAVIQENYLNNIEEAKKLFEKIILDHPGSSFISESRKAYRRLRGDNIN